MFVGVHPTLVRPSLLSVLRPQDVFRATTFNAGNGVDIAGPDLLTNGGLAWLKSRGASSHFLFDTPRGFDKYLSSQANFAEQTLAGYVSAKTTGARMDQLLYGGDPSSIAWLFGFASKFCVAIPYTGNNSNASRPLTHTLGIKPGMAIVKRLDAADDWWVWHRGLGDQYYTLFLNTVDSVSSSAEYFPQPPTANVFTVGRFSNVTNARYILYLFAHDPDPNGIIQCGSYTLNSSAAGPAVPLGWSPQLLLLKGADTNSNWYILDTARGLGTGTAYSLSPNLSAGDNNQGNAISVNSTGFTDPFNITGSSASSRVIYLAIRAPT